MDWRRTVYKLFTMQHRCCRVGLGSIQAQDIHHHKRLTAALCRWSMQVHNSAPLKEPWNQASMKQVFEVWNAWSCSELYKDKKIILCCFKSTRNDLYTLSFSNSQLWEYRLQCKTSMHCDDSFLSVHHDYTVWSNILLGSSDRPVSCEKNMQYTNY